MGFIQSAVNRTIGMFGIASRLYPENKDAKNVNPNISLQERQNKAMQNVAKKSEAQQNQSKNFLEYIKNVPTNFGKVGDLPLKIQEQIEKQMSEPQKEKLIETFNRRK